MYSFRKVKGTRFLWLKFRNLLDLSASMQVIRFHFFPAIRLRKRQFYLMLVLVRNATLVRQEIWLVSEARFSKSVGF